MNHCNRAFLAVAATWFLLLGMAWGQAGSPSALKSSAAIDAAGDKVITSFVADNIRKLEDANPDVVRAGREAMIEAGRQGTSPLSPVYAQKYADAISKGIDGLLSRSKDVRTRLNGAIVVAKVAEGTLSPRLEKAAMKLLADPQEPMKLWGMKASRAVLPELIKIGAHQNLMKRMMDVLKQQPTGSMTAEAYEALTSGSGEKKIVDTVAAPLMEIVKWRLEKYAADVPEDPAVDVIPFRYLTKVGVLDKALTTEQRMASMQLLINLMYMAALRGDEPAHKAAQEELTALINRCAQGIQVAAMIMNMPSVATVAKTVGSSTQIVGVPLMPNVQMLVEEIRKQPDFAKLTVPAAKQ